MAQIKQKTKKSSFNRKSPFNNYWNMFNISGFGIGFLFLVAGYYLMGFEPFDNPISLSYAPVVLLIAYLVIFPVAILYKKK